MIAATFMLFAAQATEPQIHRESFTYVGAEYPGELSEQVTAYQRCLRPDLQRSYSPDESVEELHRADVARCEESRTQLVETAYDIWKLDHESETARAEVEAIFAAQRDDHIARGAQLDLFMRGALVDEASDPDD